MHLPLQQFFKIIMSPDSTFYKLHSDITLPRVLSQAMLVRTIFQKTLLKVYSTPRIEMWIMEMQDVDYELVYEPGKDEADPLDFLSRHPLPETGHEKTEKIIRWNVNAEHAVVVTRIREETRKDEAMQRLAKRIAKGGLG